MYMMKNRIILVLATLLVLSFTACKKWIDAPSPMQIDQKTVFSNEQGFTDVLNGVYLQMGSQNLYGRDLSFGLLSVLGRSYDTTLNSTLGRLYYQGVQYNFQDDTVRTAMKNMWNEIYFSIGNLNNLLANIDDKSALFSGNHYHTTKGEALGLRAFLHFELLRLFVASPAVAGHNAQAIPYVTKLTPYATAPVSVDSFLNACISDLKTAQPLLDTTSQPSRFNSYAAKALLARVYLYKGDMANAQSSAMDIINGRHFPLTVNNSDLMFSTEHVFALYSYNLNAFAYYKSVYTAKPYLGLAPLDQTALYVTGSGATGDWRKSFVDPSTGNPSGNVISPKKYYVSQTNVIPLVRLSEMYYIATECAIANNDLLSATALLDTVRVHRNVAAYKIPQLTADSLNKELTKEYQKEFLGEGQMFYFYKRNNLPFSSLPYTKIPVVANASYVFIKPE
jgi:hypothetical protein